MRISVALALLVVAACQKDKEADPAAKPDQPKVADVKLVDPGAEPRKALRYHVPKGSKRSVQFAMDIDMNAGPIQGAMPTMSMVGDLAVDGVDKDGAMALAMTIHNVDLKDRPGSPVSADMMRPQMAGLDGFAIRANLTPTGAMKNVTIDASKVPAQVRSQVDSLSENLEKLAIQLPDAPVGVGAVWEESKPVEQSGIKMLTTTRLTLVKVEGDLLTFKSEATVTGEAQSISQNGVSVDIKNVKGGGGGDGTIDLGSLVTTGKFTSSFRADISAAGHDITTDMKMTMTMTPMP